MSDTSEQVGFRCPAQVRRSDFGCPTRLKRSALDVQMYIWLLPSQTQGGTEIPTWVEKKIHENWLLFFIDVLMDRAWAHGGWFSRGRVEASELARLRFALDFGGVGDMTRQECEGKWIRVFEIFFTRLI